MQDMIPEASQERTCFRGWLIGFLIFAISFSNSAIAEFETMRDLIAQASCLNLKPRKVTLVGQLIADEFPGHHEKKSGRFLYEKEDTPEAGLYFRPNNPICTPKESENYVAYQDVYLHSVKIDESDSEKFKSYIGKYLVLTGTLSSRDAEHHPSAPYILRKSAISHLSGTSKISGIYESSRDPEAYGSAVLIVQNTERRRFSVYLSITAPNLTHHGGGISVDNVILKGNILNLKEQYGDEGECLLKIQISDDVANVISEEGSCPHGTAASFEEQGKSLIKRKD